MKFRRNFQLEEQKPLLSLNYWLILQKMQFFKDIFKMKQKIWCFNFNLKNIFYYTIFSYLNLNFQFPDNKNLSVLS